MWSRCAGIVGLALLASLGPVTGSAQTVPTLGYLTNADADPVRLTDVKAALADLGYVEGRNIIVEVRGARSGSDYEKMAAELVARRVSIIIGVNATATNAARNATSTIPIVMTAVNDPVEWGFAESLERPGKNVTGTTLYAPQLVAERLRILKLIVSGLDRVSMLVVPTNAANARLFELLAKEAEALAIKVQAQQVRVPEDIIPALDDARSWGAKALVHANDAFINSQRKVIAQFAEQNRLPVMYADREYVLAGGLMALGPGHRQGDIDAAGYVDRILRGADPAEMPIARPTEFVFTVSRSRLDQLGITLPPDLSAKVNDWID
jgi:putative ABC transport system substrate-binding protein